MSERSNARLGFFLVVAFVVTAAFTAFFVAKGADRPSLKGVTYFDEPIGGLRNDSPVRYRGVDIGQVQAIALDLDTTYIRVEFEVWIDAIPEWESKALQQDVEDIDPLLRAQIATAGLIGSTFLQVDRLENPPPPLKISALPEGRHYLPSRSSDITSLFRDTRASLARLPGIIDRADSLLASAQSKIDQVDVAGINQRTLAVLDAGERAVQRIDATVQLYQPTEGPIGNLIAAATSATEGVESLLDTQTPGSLAAGGLSLVERAELLTADLRTVLPALRASLLQFQQFMRGMDAEPEQVLFGPRPQPEGAP